MEWFAVAGIGIVAAVLLLLAVAARRERTTVAARADRLQRDLSDVRAAVDVARAGEREAAWALDQAVQRIDSERAEALARVATLEAQIDDLIARLSIADADLSTARAETEEAQAEAAFLRSRLEPPAETPDPRPEPELPGSRVAGLLAELQSERDEVSRLRQELDRARTTEPATTDQSYRERLVASEARRRDLEDRLAALTSIRAAEQRSAADRIAGLERLHVRVAERDERIEDLASDLKHAEESRDDALAEASRLQVEIVRLKTRLADAERELGALQRLEAELGESRTTIASLESRLETLAGSEKEIARLERALDAERARSERIARRAAEQSTDTSYAMWERVLRERVDSAVTRETGRLTARIEHLQSVVAEKEARLGRLARGRQAPSDLPPITAIKGIGVAIAGILVDRGIATIADVAALSQAEIDALAEHMPIYPGRIRDDDWVGQARAIVAGESDPEPVPVPVASLPITAIKGIGPAIADILASHGVTTIADVAALDGSDLEAIAAEMPVYPGRIRDDDWVGQAQDLLARGS